MYVMIVLFTNRQKRVGENSEIWCCYNGQPKLHIQTRILQSLKWIYYLARLNIKLLFPVISTIPFSTDGVPPDGTPVTVVTSGNTGVIIKHVLLFATSTFFIIICLGFNIVFKNRKQFPKLYELLKVIWVFRIVKLTSPNLNYVMIAGTTALTLSIPAFTGVYWYFESCFCCYILYSKLTDADMLWLCNCHIV